jgi:methyl-accepting chemotaxis protein
LDKFYKKFNCELQGDLKHEIALGDNEAGNITKINNEIERIHEKLQNQENNLNDTYKQLENAKIEVKKPFPKEQELVEKSKRLVKLEEILSNSDEIKNEVKEVVKTIEPSKRVIPKPNMGMRM